MYITLQRMHKTFMSTVDLILSLPLFSKKQYFLNQKCCHITILRITYRILAIEISGRLLISRFWILFIPKEQRKVVSVMQHHTAYVLRRINAIYHSFDDLVFLALRVGFDFVISSIYYKCFYMTPILFVQKYLT